MGVSMTQVVKGKKSAGVDMVNISGIDAKLKALAQKASGVKTPKGMVKVENMDKIVLALRRQAESEKVTVSRDMIKYAYKAHNAKDADDSQLDKIQERVSRDMIKLNDKFYVELTSNGYSLRGYENGVSIYLSAGQFDPCYEAMTKLAKMIKGA